MTLVRLSFLLIICFAISGCANNRGMIHDYDVYDSGKPKNTSDTYFNENENKFTHSSEYYENGRLKLECWYEFDRPLHKLEFYDNGQLKSEERFINGKLDYGAYYKENGQITQTTGQLIDWITLKNLGKP